jgi:type I restriction enzyme S subunit
MKNGWPRIPLGNLLTEKAREVAVEAATEYSLLGAHWYAKGLYVKETKPGSQIKASKVYRIHAGDFVYNRLFAWKGAFAVASEDIDGTHVSNEFPCFEVHHDQLHPHYLWLYFSREAAWNEALGLSFGATPTSRNRLKQANLLAMTIPLPPLPEQRRIVGRIEELAAQITEARTLRQEAVTETGVVVSRAIAALLDTPRWERKPLGDVLAESPRHGLSPKSEVESGGRPMLRINAVSSSPTRFVDLSAKKDVEVSDKEAAPFLLRDDDVFVVRYNGDINRVAKPAIFKANGSCPIVFPDKLMRLRPDRTRMSPDFLVYALGARSVREQVEELGKTTAGNIGISAGNVKSFVVPTPPMHEQQRIVVELDGLQAQVDALKRLQAETAAELDALLPSILDKAFKGCLRYE